MSNQSTIKSSLKIKAIVLAVIGLAASGLWAYVFAYNVSEGTGAPGLVLVAVSFLAYLVPSILLLRAKTTERIKVLATILGVVAAIGMAVSLASGGGGGIVYILVLLLAVFVTYSAGKQQA